MIVYDIIALLIGFIALLIAYSLLKKLSGLSKDKERTTRIVENLSVGILSGVIVIILQIYFNSIKGIPIISFDSGIVFLKSLGISLGNLFIVTSIMLAVLFFALYTFLKPILNKRS